MKISPMNQMKLLELFGCKAVKAKFFPKEQILNVININNNN